MRYSLIATIIAMIVAILGVGIITGVIPLLLSSVTTQATCQDIWAYYPAWRCCDYIQSYTGSKILTSTPNDYNRMVWQCPPTAYKCEYTIVMSTNLGAFKIGSGNCYFDYYGQWTCPNERYGNPGSDIEIHPGDYIYTSYHSVYTWLSVPIDYKVFDYKLCDCPLNPCGVPCPEVLGSTKCGFVTTDDVYDENGRIKINGVMQPGGAFAYTVPYGECYSYYPEVNRHPIGNTCEECATTADCITKYPDTYNYLGKTYGAVCIASQLQLYDCLDSGTRVCTKERYDKAGHKVECLEYGTKSKCDLYLTIPVECCPGTGTCGPQAFCDPETYRCVTTAECTYDYDCGRTVTCDYTTKQLKTPRCVGGMCTFSVEDVDCCYDVNCPSGWFCDSDYRCKEKPIVKKTCPFECCENEPYYFDKKCSVSEPVCCPDNTCAKTVEECTSIPKPKEMDWLWLWIPLLTIFGGLLGLGRNRDPVLAGVGAIIGGIVGYIIYMILSNWFIILILGIIGVAGMGILIYLGFGVIVFGILAGVWRVAKGGAGVAYKGVRRRW